MRVTHIGIDLEPQELQLLINAIDDILDHDDKGEWTDAECKELGQIRAALFTQLRELGRDKVAEWARGGQ